MPTSQTALDLIYYELRRRLIQAGKQLVMQQCS